MDRAATLEQIVRELIAVLYLLLLEDNLPSRPEWAGWRTISEANGLLRELGLPTVERPGGTP